MSRFLRFLGIQAGEGAVAGGLFAYSLLLGVGRVFVLTASQALFLEFYPASDLAWVYMIAAVTTIATSAAYLRLGRTLAPRDLILANLGFTLLVTVILRALLGVTGAAWPAMLLAAWFHVMFALSSFAFWGAATQVVDIRQGKRLFPVATTGDVLAFSLGGFLILRTVDRMGTPNLLWIGAAGFGLAIGALLYTLAHRSTEPAPAGGAIRERAADVRWSSRYLRLMMAYFVLSAAVFIFLDNAFNDVAQRRFEGAAELARFFGTYSAIAALVNFVFRSLFAGRLVRRLGLVFGLAVLPAAVGFGASGIGIAGTLLPGLGLVFWLTVATRLSDKVLRGVQQASMASLYQPLGAKGPAVQTTMDGIIDSAAIGVAGAVILGLNQLFELTAVELSFAIVVLCLLWVGVAIALKREFVEVLGGALHRRRLAEGAIEFGSEEVLGVIRRQLDSPYPEEVVYAIRLLDEARDPSLPAMLERLLDHDAEDVRIEALRRLAVLGHLEDGGRVVAIARDGNASPRLRGAAVRTLGQVSETIPPEVSAALEAREPALRRGAMVGLLCSGSIEGIVYAGAALLEDLRSERPEHRMAGAEVLRDAAIPSFFRQVRDLLEDPEPAVQVRAIQAAAAIGHPELWGIVVERMRDTRLAPAVSEALLRAGPSVIPHIVKAFRRDPDDRQFRISALRILGLLGGEEAVRALLPLIETRDREERTAIFTALAHCGLDAPAGLMEALCRQLDVELQNAADAFSALADLEPVLGGCGTVETGVTRGPDDGPADAGAALRSALDDEIHGARHRLFLLLSFLRPGRDLLTAWENYASGTRERRAYALELLDSHLTTGERGRVFAVLDEQHLADRLEALDHVGLLRRLGEGERLADLASREDLSPWTRLCARWVAAQRAVEGADGVPPLTGEELRLCRRTTRLRRMELFGELPGAVLARMVPKLQRVEVEGGEPVFGKGEEGDGMYVVLDGRVRVHDNGRELAVLGADTVFGEFTVLQRQPRTASVTALEPTRLLRFTQEDLHELIREQVAVGRALIRVILRRLRENREISSSGPEEPG